MPKASIDVHYDVRIQFSVPVEVEDTGDRLTMSRAAKDKADEIVWGKKSKIDWLVMINNNDHTTTNVWTSRR